MGRWIVSLSVFGLLGMAVGCNHTAGICDCDARTWNCRSGPGGYGYMEAAHAAPQAEMLKEMPKTKEKN